MGRLGGASRRALFYFSNFLEFLDEKISKIKTVLFSFGYIRITFQNYKKVSELPFSKSICLYKGEAWGV